MPAPQSFRDIVVSNDIGSVDPRSGYDHVVLVGSDIRTLDTAMMLAKIPLNGTFSLTARPASGFTCQISSWTNSTQPAWVGTEWRATASGTVTVPLSLILHYDQMNSLSQADAIWMGSNGFMIRSNMGGPGDPVSWSGWNPATSIL